MAKEFIKPVCLKCGENARPGALFCFACGGQIVEGADTGEEDVSSEWFKGDIMSADGGTGQASKTAKEADIEAESSDQTLVEESEESDKTERSEVTVAAKDILPEDLSKVKKSKNKRLRSAAELRNKPKAVRTRNVEVVWEEKTGSPNWLFVLFGLTLFVVAVFLAVAAFYLK